ncbi:hypothetical protein BC834DRAFT_562767 [Gloeopeniophorella convolvens]|nr:hypothetical protein BC834DRAFT_562767 [Gloeopeniophorella convolvens]
MMPYPPPMHTHANIYIYSTHPPPPSTPVARPCTVCPTTPELAHRDPSAGCAGRCDGGRAYAPLVRAARKHLRSHVHACCSGARTAGVLPEPAARGSAGSCARCSDGLRDVRTAAALWVRCAGAGGVRTARLRMRRRLWSTMHMGIREVAARPRRGCSGMAAPDHASTSFEPLRGFEQTFEERGLCVINLHRRGDVSAMLNEAVMNPITLEDISAPDKPPSAIAHPRR